MLAPIADSAGPGYVGFDTFRHTCASLLFAAARTSSKGQEWLADADPAFTLKTYVNLVDDDLGDADFLEDALAVPASIH